MQSGPFAQAGPEGPLVPQGGPKGPFAQAGPEGPPWPNGAAGAWGPEAQPLGPLPRDAEGVPGPYAQAHWPKGEAGEARRT